MRIFLDETKYEYELKMLIQQFSDDKLIFQPIIQYSGETKNYLILYAKNDDSHSVICSGSINNIYVSFSNYQLPNETNLKNAYKRALYDSLIMAYSTDLDWGILTGIRPTKLYNEFANSNSMLDRPKQATEFSKQYCVNNEKIQRLQEICRTQKTMFQNIGQRDYSIYIHVPFCPSKCSYCTFFSNEISKKQYLVKPYIKALMDEIQQTLSHKWCKERNISTLYIGGGTPSCLSAQDLEDFLCRLNNIVDFSGIFEITFEAGRPDTLNIEKLRILKANGITRISINPQTMVDQTLTGIGRNHTSDDIVSAFIDARKVGLDNINMDLILGLENERLEDFCYSMDKVLSLNPESITVHSLSYKKTSSLAKIRPFSAKTQQSKVASEMMLFAHQQMRKYQYFPYYLYRQKNIVGGQENIGFSKTGKESVYNAIIIEEYQSILAFGPGAVSRFIYPDENRIERISNPKNLEHYIQNIEEFVSKKRLEMNHESNPKT